MLWCGVSAFILRYFMLPYIHVLSREIPMYGITTGVGVLLAVLYLKYAEKRYPELEADVELAFVYGIVGAFVGAKILFLVTVFPDFWADFHYLCTQTAAFLETYLYAGFVFYGGLYGAVLSVCLYARVAKVSAQRLLNILLPVLPLIHCMGRIGCFCAGCCYGRYSERWGIYFFRSEIAPHDVPLLPVQLYEAVGALLLFAGLAYMGAKKADGKKMLAVYLLAYGIMRFALEFIRGDAYRGFLLGMSVSQIISTLSVVLAAILFCWSHRKRSSAAI